MDIRKSDLWQKARVAAEGRDIRALDELSRDGLPLITEEPKVPLVEIAARYGQNGVLKFLISRRAGFLHYWQNAFTEALSNKDAAIVKTLVSAGAPVDFRDCYRATALMIFAGEGDLDAVKFLLRYGALSTATDREGRSAIDYAEAGRARYLAHLAMLRDSYLLHCEEVHVMPNHEILDGFRDAREFDEILGLCRVANIYEEKGDFINGPSVKLC